MNRKRQLLLGSCVLLAAALAGSATAQILFKSTDRDGRVSYADKPAPGAVKVEQFQIVPTTTEDPARAAAESERLRQQAEQTRERERQREAALDQAHAEVLAALDALKQAQQRREAGIEPLPGERQGLRGGGSRLAPSYFARQRDLDREVSEAQQRLDKAYARRNELR
jgi:chromosome segregation ATPase